MKTLVLGASSDTNRYSNMAVKKLKSYGHEVIAIGKKEDMIDDTKIVSQQPMIDNIHTVTLYLNPSNQKPYYDYILNLHPKRIIFNPGTENQEFEELIKSKNIEAIEACTLVMLSTGIY
jgi:predicted CoA-binding protein